MDRNKAKAYWRRFTITGKVNGQQMQVMDFNNFVNAITEWENSSRVELPVMQNFTEPERSLLRTMLIEEFNRSQSKLHFDKELGDVEQKNMKYDLELLKSMVIKTGE